MCCKERTLKYKQRGKYGIEYEWVLEQRGSTYVDFIPAMEARTILYVCIMSYIRRSEPKV